MTSKFETGAVITKNPVVVLRWIVAFSTRISSGQWS